ncbi:MAG: hypothetical protein AB8H47_13065, partial [Bacteroidia bacterium]
MKRYFSLILLGGMGLGLLLPIDLGENLKYLIWAELFIIILLSYFQMELKLADIRAQSWRILGFYIVRFVLFPSLLFLLINPWDDFYSQGVFLLAVLPVGVTAPALTAIFKGRMELSLILLVLSSMLTPLVMPFLSQWLLGSALSINAWQMLGTLAFTIFLPFLLYLPLRQRPQVVAFARKINSPVVIFLLAGFVVLISAQNRELIFANPITLLWHLGVAGAAYTLFYFVGWWGFGRSAAAERISLSFSSGANNIALGIAVGYTYFSPEIGFFFVAGQLVWTLMLLPVERVISNELREEKSKT